MLLNVIFVHCISLAEAYLDINNGFQDIVFPSDGLREVIRNPRFARKYEFEEFSPNCDHFGRTSLSPYVVILLLRNSGNFLGMGSIIDKARVLTARKVVEHSAYSPNDILALAGRLGPWWGKNSQVKVVDEIYQNDGDLALAKTKDPFYFNTNISPIKLPIPRLGQINNGSFAVFGISRSGVEVPGDPTPKTSMYFVTIETPMDNNDDCTNELPEVEFNDTLMFCSSTNGTYGWGCIGSPTVAVDKDGRVVQIGVITHTAVSEKDVCHVHTKITPFSQWIRSHGLVNYRVPNQEP